MKQKRIKIENNRGENTILRRLNEFSVRNTVKMVGSWKED
jgi:hypothetical protein